METLDLLEELKGLYRPPGGQPVIVDVPELHYLMIDGEGDPNVSADYQAVIEALYTASYTLKFKVKRRQPGIDYKVMPLEGLWWADHMGAFRFERKHEYKWTMMIAQPSILIPELVAEAVDETARKKDLPALSMIRFETLTEGTSAQILHLGPYTEERPTIEKLHAFIEEQGYRKAGKHHEIYLSDPRRTAPERLKTVIRQPIASRQDTAVLRHTRAT